jgi:hypothetical protein
LLPTTPQFSAVGFANLIDFDRAEIQTIRPFDYISLSIGLQLTMSVKLFENCLIVPTTVGHKHCDPSLVNNL